VPSTLRKRLRRGDEGLPTYFEQYRAHLKQHDDALEHLYDLVTKRRCCLLCLEQKPEECHRSVLAEVLARRNGDDFPVRHI
jgi:uncharacterized protein YeaO (DUF488 family)